MFRQLHGTLLAVLLWAGTSSNAGPIPLTRVHAHNDYEHKRPLLDALDHGFCSVEADIYLVDGQLCVAHERREIRPERTLQSLYLEPLRQRVKQNGGRVYPNGPEVTLLIDLKSDWTQIYPVLRGVLKEYCDMLVTFQDGVKRTNAVIAIITGNRSKAMFDGETVRYASFDGDLKDLDAGGNADLIPWISSQWSETFSWRGNGDMPEPQKQKLEDIVTRAHQQSRKVRFWGAPDKPAFWSELLRHNVDLINTDDLEGAQKFLLESPKLIAR